jgi:hypothetical protein
MNSFLQVEIIADNKSKQIDISHLLKKKQLTKQTESAKFLKISSSRRTQNYM